MPYSDPAKQREYQLAWALRRRREWLAANGPCAKCGSSEDLEVDHIEPETKVSHRVWSFSKARREAALAKCQALCGTCHQAKTSAEKRRPLEHGTEAGYSAKDCRCAACTSAHRDYRRRQRCAALVRRT